MFQVPSKIVPLLEIWLITQQRELRRKSGLFKNIHQNCGR